MHTAQGNADLKSTFGKNRHDLNVSTQQMCILLLFNSADTLSYADIQEATQVTELADGSKGRVCVYYILILLWALRRTTQGRLLKGMRTARVGLVPEMSARVDAAAFAAATAIVRALGDTRLAWIGILKLL